MSQHTAQYPQLFQYGAHNRPSTPWGLADSGLVVAPGIIQYSTASHGGFYLSPDRIAEMPPTLKATPTFAGDGWYEEDCDWSLVVVSFPQFFSEVQLLDASTDLKRWRKDISWWIDSAEAAPVRSRLESFMARNGKLFRPIRVEKGERDYCVHYISFDGTLIAEACCLTRGEAELRSPVDVAKFGARAEIDPNPALASRGEPSMAPGQ